MTEMTDDKEFYGGIITDEQKETLKKALELKNRMIDVLIDKSFKEKKQNAYNTIVLYLKVDIQICEALIRMDVSSKESVETEFHNIMDYIENSVQPKNMNLYVDLLTDEEKQLEADTAKIMMHIQRVMLGRYYNMVRN